MPACAQPHPTMTLSPETPVYGFSDYLRRRFGERVYKVSLDAGFTCPNRDGSKAWGGCTFCNNEGFSVHSGSQRQPLAVQFERSAAFIRRRFRARKFIAYFQAYTNTYGNIDRLRATYDEVVHRPDVVGMAVGTRPDCVTPEILDLLESYASDDRDVWVEYGLQTRHDATLRAINRGHDVQAFEDAMAITRRRRLKVCVHLILGLPGETRPMMLDSVDYLSDFAIHGVKLHVLHILRGTEMARQYAAGELSLLSLDDYIGLVCDALERIAPATVIHRLSADAPPHMLVAPAWCAQKGLVRTRIFSAFLARGTHQGCRLGQPAGSSC